MRPSRPSLAIAALCALVLASPASAATDKYRFQQWGLDATSVPEAWQQATGDGVVVAVVDSGIELDHPDLQGAIWTNPDEVAGNGVDDDANGIVDDVHGANMLEDNADIRDEQDHGTGVAGIIAARADNGLGGAGIAPRAQIMTVKVCGATTCELYAEAKAIRYAVNEGARIINVSIGGNLAPDALKEAVAFAEANGATVVAAAGNEREDNDAVPTFPASLPEAGVLAVTAVEEGGTLSEQVNWGSETVDLAAPGTGNVTTSTGKDYRLSAGTSFAAPFVSGSLALLASARPDLPQAELRAALLSTADRTDKLAGKVATGMVDVGAAMHRLVPGVWGTAAKPAATAADSSPRAGIASNGRAKVAVKAPSKVRGGRRVAIRWNASNADVAKWQLTVNGYTRTLGAAKRGTATYIGGGASRVRVRVAALDADGRKIAAASKTLRVVR